MFFSETSAIDYKKTLQNRTLFAPFQAGFVVSVSLGVAMWFPGHKQIKIKKQFGHLPLDESKQKVFAHVS